MDALVMCGGQGSRLDAPVEKPLFEVADRPMVDHVCTALAESSLDTVYAAPSPQTPNTRAHLRDQSVSLVETPGEGYVADLDAALNAVSRPVVTAAADLPLLDAAVVDRLRSRANGDSLALAAPAALKHALGVGYDRSFTADGRRLVPTGLNVVGPDREDATHVTYDARTAVNVNTLADAEVAARLLRSTEGGA